MTAARELVADAMGKSSMSSRKKQSASSSNPEDLPDGDLAAIKRLLVLGLLRSGASQRQIANALHVNQSQVSRMFPGGIGLPKKDRE